MVTRAGLLIALAVACQGNRDRGDGSSKEPAPRDAAAIVVEEAAVPIAREDAGTKPEEPEPRDENSPSKVIAELGAIPAWQTVIDRAQLLGRREQHGVAYGRIGPTVMVPAPVATAGSGSGSGGARGSAAPAKVEFVASPYAWLVDDTEGNGSLGIRIALGGKSAKVKEGDRVAVGGAWHLDDGKRWYWKVDSLQTLPPAPASDVKDPKPAEPNHVIQNGNLLPGSRTITVARDHDAVFFQIVGPPPANDGDGWPVADELGDKVFALLVLPGERSSYGGQDMRAADERWTLKRANTYLVRIGKIRNRGPDKPVVMYARTAPVRVN